MSPTTNSIKSFIYPSIHASIIYFMQAIKQRLAKQQRVIVLKGTESRRRNRQEIHVNREINVMMGEVQSPNGGLDLESLFSSSSCLIIFHLKYFLSFILVLGRA